MHTFLLGIHLGVMLLGHRLYIYLTLLAIPSSPKWLYSVFCKGGKFSSTFIYMFLFYLFVVLLLFFANCKTGQNFIENREKT
jgi:hypothetical protein